MRVAIYDVSERPITFDIICWLANVGAELGDEPVHIVILADRWREKTTKDRSLSDAQKLRRAKHILEPSCWLLRNTAAVSLVRDRAAADRWRGVEALRPDTFMRTALDHWRAGRDIFRLGAPADALDDIGARFDDAVILNIRQTSAVPEKNCRLSSWLRLAGHIRSTGKRVVLIPDTDMVVSGVPLPASYEWFPAAAMDVGLRVAVCERASLCMGLGVGPLQAIQFMRGKRYGFVMKNRGLASTSLIRSFEKVWGIAWGEQLPFAGPGQWMDFRTDDEDVLIDLYERVTQ